MLACHATADRIGDSVTTTPGMSEEKPSKAISVYINSEYCTRMYVDLSLVLTLARGQSDEAVRALFQSRFPTAYSDLSTLPDSAFKMLYTLFENPASSEPIYVRTKDRIFIQSRDKEVTILDAKSGKRLKAMPVNNCAIATLREVQKRNLHRGEITNARFQGDRLFTAGTDNVIKVWALKPDVQVCGVPEIFEDSLPRVEGMPTYDIDWSDYSLA